MSTSFLSKIPRKTLENGKKALNSMGEIWLVMQANPELSESAAISGGMGKFCNMDKEFNGFSKTPVKSLNEDMKNNEGSITTTRKSTSFGGVFGEFE